MKKLIVLSTAALVAFTPLLATAQAQTRSPAGPSAGHKIEQQAPAKPQARRQQWKKGSKYSGKGTRVSDHRRHNLKAPPRGHRWVRDGNDFLLVAIGTGIIASIVTGR